MYKKLFKPQNVSTDIIRLDKTFQRIWNSVITKQFFIEGVRKFGIYTRPTGYMKDGYCYILGHQCSVDAMLELGQEEVEMDIIDIEQAEIALFLIIFLAKEHKTLKCTAELIRLILEYIETPEGKDWFVTILDKGDKEDMIACLLDITKYEVKSLLLLLQPDNDAYLKMLADGDSLNAAVTACKDAKQVQVKPKKKANIPAGKPSARIIGLNNPNPQSSANPSEQGADSDDVFFNNWGDFEFDDEVVTNNDDDEQEEFDDVDDDFFEDMLDEYKKKDKGNGTKLIPLGLIRKVALELNDGCSLDLVGRITLTVDGKEITSTDQLCKTPDGTWQLPSGSQKYCLTAQAC